MAIARTQKDSLVDVSLGDKKVHDIAKKKQNNGEDIVSQPLKPKKISKSFLATTIAELQKVDWPSFPYTLRWSGVIVVFTLALSLFLGFFDNVFTSSIRFVNCVSPQGDARELQVCGEDLVSDLTFQSEN